MQSLDRYQAFYAAAKEENFSKAATELQVTQSAISQAIRQLEDSLGVQLFLRSGRRVRLSPDGRYLFEQLEPIIFRLETTERQLMESQDPNQARLILGASDTLCRHYLLPSFEAFHRTYPEVRLEIVNAPSPEIARLVRENKLDVGFVHGWSEDFPDLNTHCLRVVEEVFFTSRHYPVSPRTREELSQLPFVSLTKRSATRELLDEYFRADVSGWKPLVEVISIDLMIDLVRSGFGISYTHRDLIETEEFHILEVAPIKQPREIVLLQPKTKYPSQTLKRFEEFLQSV